MVNNFQQKTLIGLFLLCFRVKARGGSILGDLFEDPKYDFKISSSFIPESSITKFIDNRKSLPGIVEGINPVTPSRRLIIRTGQKERFLCDIATPPIDLKLNLDKSRESVAQEGHIAEKNGLERGLSLLNELDGDCITSLTGWWSYKFCFKGEIIQYHIPTNEEEANDPDNKIIYVLGRYSKGIPLQRVEDSSTEVGDRTSSFSNSIEMAQIRNDNDKNVLVEKWGGGTDCDLTGRQRSVEIMYECYPTVPKYIISVKEVSTCNYKMVLSVPKLCEDTFYTEKKQLLSYPILCAEIIPDADLQKRQKQAEEEAAAAKKIASPEIEDGVNSKPKKRPLSKVSELVTLSELLEKFGKLALVQGDNHQKTQKPDKGKIDKGDSTKGFFDQLFGYTDEGSKNDKDSSNENQEDESSGASDDNEFKDKVVINFDNFLNLYKEKFVGDKSHAKDIYHKDDTSGSDEDDNLDEL